jgi:hypothetical protein
MSKLDQILSELQQLRAEIDGWRQFLKLRAAIEEISLIVDVMIGDGPGAVQAYYGEHPTIRGLPTQYAHLKAHAREIREIIVKQRESEI